MSNFDSLVATRARRANAGSRLKQLIEIEEQATGVSNIVYTDDDENVQLLFQEDENDEEFEQSQSGESDIEIDEDEGEDEGEGEGEDKDQDIEDGNKDVSKNVAEGNTVDMESAINPDEMLSDSDISASENDDSEGERELQKAEKSKKRKSKGGPVIPAIKKPKLVVEKPKPKEKTKHSELLLNLDRRASSRKSAMRNKEVLVKKLREDESRRAALTPVVRAKEVKLTQEERLAQAIETEKENVISLHSFLQQEIVKKEHQKLLFQQRRLKLRNVVRLISRETYIAPIDEIEDARHVIDLFDKKKRGRRRRPATETNAGPRPGDIDKELPYYKKEMEDIRLREEKEAAEKERIEKEREERRRIAAEQEEKWRLKLEQERERRRIAKEQRFKEFENVDVTEHQSRSSVDTENSGGDVAGLTSTEDENIDDAKALSNVVVEDEAKCLVSDAEDKAVAAEIDNEEAEKSRLEETNKREAEDKAVVAEIDNEEAEKSKLEETSKREAEDITDVTEELEARQEGNQASEELTGKSELASAQSGNEDLEKIEVASKDESNLETEEKLEKVDKDTEMDEAELTETVTEEGSERVSEVGTEATIEAATEAPIETTIKDPIENNDDPETNAKEEKRVTFADMDVSPGDGANANGEADTGNGEKVQEETSHEDEEKVQEETTHEDEEIEDELEDDLSYRPSKEGQVFEGPVQKVSKNHIILVDFDEESYFPYLTEARVKTVLFGEDANLGTSRKFKDVKTILKSSIRSDNPYGSLQEEKEDEIFKPISEITKDDAIFESLKRLPRLGVKEVFEVEEKNVQEEETADIQIRTEAPTGLYLPNGNRKLCLISGNEVRYFDPATGIPYENKDVYKIIKTIEQGLIPWYSIGADQNAYGKVELYLNHRGGSRHAKGVPEGFDGC